MKKLLIVALALVMVLGLMGGVAVANPGQGHGPSEQGNENQRATENVPDHAQSDLPFKTLAVKTINHELLDPSDPVFADSGGYFLNMGFEVNRDLDLKDDNVQFISYYEFKTDEEEGIVKNSNGDPFARSKEWNFIRYGDLVDPEPQPDVLKAGTQYFFAATGNTNNRLYSLAELETGTEYEVRVVYVITDEHDNETTTYSQWEAYIR